MNIRPISDLSDGELWGKADRLEAHERLAMAQLLVCIAEINARMLFVKAGYSSMHACCMERWRMSEDMAFRRMRVAKKGYRFPVIFEGLAAGRFHLSGLALLAPHLDESNAEELLAEAVNKSKREIELLIARRFPQTDVPTLVGPVVGLDARLAAAPTSVTPMPAPGPVETPPALASSLVVLPRAAPGPVAPAIAPAEPARIQTPTVPAVPFPRVAPLAPERFALQLTMDQETHDLLREAQALSNQPAQSEIPDVLKRALRLYVAKLKARKFGATSRPQKKRRPSKSVRVIPAAVRRAVAERDGNRCTYVNDAGKRCTGTTDLEYDHIVPVARGGESTVGNLRQRCRPHNQLEAERVFGAAFMVYKREQSRSRRTLTTQGTVMESPAAVGRVPS